MWDCYSWGCLELSGVICRVEGIAGWRCRELRVVAAKLPDGRQSGLAERPDRGRCSAKHANDAANFELSHPRPRLSLAFTHARTDKSTLSTSPGLSLNPVTHFATDLPTRRAIAAHALTSTHAQRKGSKGTCLAFDSSSSSLLSISSYSW
jgi:hypothetical protein